MTSDMPRVMHPYEVEYDSNGSVAFRNFTAYEMTNDGELIQFVDADGLMVFTVHASRVISINRRDADTGSPKSIVNDVIREITRSAQTCATWLKI